MTAARQSQCIMPFTGSAIQSRCCRGQVAAGSIATIYTFPDLARANQSAISFLSIQICPAQGTHNPDEGIGPVYTSPSPN